MQYNKQSILFSLPQILLLISGLSSLAACNSLQPVSNAVELTGTSGTAGSIRGFVIERDGATPIYGATVAILSAADNNKQANTNNLSKVDSDNESNGGYVSYESNALCAPPSKTHLAYTCTIEDGSFKLDLSKIRDFPVTIRVENMQEAKEIIVTTKELNSDLGMITLVSESTELKEKVAVVMDFYNPLDDIKEFLSENPSQTQEVKLQLMQEYQSLYKIGSDETDIIYPTFFSLFNDTDKDGKADIFNYDVVYINSRQKSDIALLDQSIRKELLNYISNGGSLFITEWSVQVEQEEPTPDQYI